MIKLEIRSRVHEFLLISVVSLYILAFSVYTLFRHWAYGTAAWDLAIFDQALWSTLHGKFFYVSFMPGHSPFAFHTQFILILLLPIYFLFPYPETLLVLQTIILGLGAIGIYLIAQEILGNKDLALAFAVSYLLYPQLHGINRFDFHPEALATTFIIFAFYYLLKNNYRKAYILSFLTLLCKEDAAFAVFSLGLYIVVRKLQAGFHKSFKVSSTLTIREFLWGLLFMVSSLIYFYIAVFYVIPHFNPYGEFPHWKRFGSSKFNPVMILSNIRYQIDRKILYTVLLLIPLLFLPLLDPPFLLLATPLFAEYFLATYPLQYFIGYQYAYALIPFLFIASVRSLKTLIPESKHLSTTIVRKWASYLVLVSLISTLLYSPTPYGIFNSTMRFIVVDEEWYEPNIRTRILDRIISLIPDNASVSTQNDILPHICHRFDVYLGYVEGVDYILIDTHLPWAYDPNWSPLPNGKFSADLLQKYGILVNIDGIFLLKENYSSAPIDPRTIGIINGLKAEYHPNTNFAGEPVYEEYILTLDINWGPKAPFITVPSDHFSVIISGYLYIPVDGNYTFRLSSDDGSTLYIDNIIIINGSSSLPIRKESSVYLTKGYHEIRIEFTEYVGNAAIKLEWKKPCASAYEVIPPKYLFIAIP